MTIPLIETTFPTWGIIQEEASASSDEKRPMRLSGVFQKANTRNANGRYYPREVLKREVDRLQADLAEGRIFMEADHPEGDSPASTTRVTGILRRLWMEGDEVWGEEEVVETAAGKDIAAIARVGGKIGVSSRGRGSVAREAIEGVGECDVVGEDFQLVTFDHVIGPSVRVAEITQVREQQEAREMKDLTLETLKGEHAELYQALRKEVADELAADFEKKVLEKASAPETVDKIIQAVYTQVMEDLEKNVKEENPETHDSHEPEPEHGSEDVEHLRHEIEALKAKLVATEVEKYIEVQLAADPDRALLIERVKRAAPQTITEVDKLVENDKKFLADARKSFGTPKGLGTPMLEGFNPENPTGRVTNYDRFTTMARRAAGLPTDK